jgi:hypothetical protein
MSMFVFVDFVPGLCVLFIGNLIICFLLYFMVFYQVEILSNISHLVILKSCTLSAIGNLCICDYQSLIIVIQSNSSWQINNYLYKNKSYLPFLRGTWSHLGFNNWVQCCGVRYESRIKTMLSSFLPPVVCRRAHVVFTLFVFVCA